MANTRRPARGHGSAHNTIRLSIFLTLFLLQNLISCMSMTASQEHKGTCAVTDVGTTQCNENKGFVSTSEETKHWGGEPSHQCQNVLVPIFVLHHKRFVVPATAVAISCISTAEEIKLGRGLSSSQLPQRHGNVFAADDHFQRKSCSRCQTGPWRAWFSGFTCWTVWSPRFICWVEMTRLLRALGSQMLSPFCEGGDSQGGRDALSGSVRFLLLVTLVVLIYIFFHKIKDPNIQSSSVDVAVLIHRQREALKQFQNAVTELFMKILNENKKKKRTLSAKRLAKLREEVKVCRRCLRKFVRRQTWSFKELRPSRFGASAQQKTDFKKKEAETTPNEEKQPSSLRWHNVNVMHRVLLPSEGGTSGVHTYVQKQRQDEEKLLNFWRLILRKRNRRYRPKGPNKSKDIAYETQAADTGIPPDTAQRRSQASGRSIHSEGKEGLSERPALSSGVQQDVEDVRRCMYSIFHAFLKDASEWRYWQRNEQMSFIEVVLDQLGRWKKLQLAFEGRILDSTFKLTVIANTIVSKFQAISIHLTDEEIKGARLVRYATSRGKGAAAAAVEAHSGSWAHLTEAALDARLIRQTQFLRTQFEEQKKYLASTTAQTRHVESSLEQARHEYMRRLAMHLQKSFEREVEKSLTQLTSQRSPPPVEDMKNTQIKAFDRSHGLAGGAQEITRPQFQNQQELLDRMATKLHMILDRHVERDSLQGQKIQQLLHACFEKTEKQLAIVLEKTISHGSRTSASLLQQQSELRRICEAHKDQGDRISQMVEGLARQQKNEQSISGGEPAAGLSLERNVTKVFRDELQAAKKEMEEKLRQIEQQNRATQCSVKEESTAEVKRMVNAVTSQLQHQCQEHRFLHETLLIHRRDTLELLKHFTHLALCPEWQQVDNSLPDTTAIQIYSTVTSTTDPHSHTETSIHSEERLTAGDSTGLLQAEKTAESHLSIQSDSGDQLERETRESSSVPPGVALNTQEGNPLRHALRDRTSEETLSSQPACERPPLPVKADESSCRKRVLTDSGQKHQESMQRTSACSARLEIERLIQTQKFELLLERWKRSIRDAEVIDRNRARSNVGPKRFSHNAVKTRHESNCGI